MDIFQIAQAVKSRRHTLNIDQSTLSALAGIGINTLVSIEKGTGNPQIKTLLALLDTLGLQLTITLKD